MLQTYMQKIISWVAVLLWMAFIFTLSSQAAEQSNQLSTGVTKVVVETVEKVVPSTELDEESFNHIIRKNAHFFAYLVLGILVTNALRRNGVRGYRSVGIALVICVLYACSDEFHQVFVPGRGGQVLDVIIDSAGVSVGLGIYFLIGRLAKKYRCS